ncbi:ABC transporter ATP-binding protein, partial [bacterium]|nr:ABC transporter ATP-binding protein [bacterium]
MIEVTGLSIRFGQFLLQEVNLAIHSGESFFILGPSGAGKSLLMETLLGIRRPDAGKVFLDGRDITDLPPAARQVAYVPQDLALFPHLTVRENILFGLTIQGISTEEMSERLSRMVDLLELQEIINRKNVLNLSGGEKQRVALARSLILNPKVLFMDEPFKALDVSLRRRLLAEVRHLQKSLGLTLVHVTHDPEEAFLLADRMIILMDGRIEQVGTPNELYYKPGNLRVAAFLMLQNLFQGQVGKKTGDGYQEIFLEDEDVMLLSTPSSKFPEGSPVLVGARPEEVIIVAPGRPPD